MRSKTRTGLLTATGMNAVTQWAGAATVASGTTVASVAATACKSGSLVFLGTAQYTSAVVSQGYGLNFTASSIDNGRFMIFAVGSIAPLAPVQVNWMVVRRV